VAEAVELSVMKLKSIYPSPHRDEEKGALKKEEEAQEPQEEEEELSLREEEEEKEKEEEEEEEGEEAWLKTARNLLYDMSGFLHLRRGGGEDEEEKTISQLLSDSGKQMAQMCERLEEDRLHRYV